VAGFLVQNPLSRASKARREQADIESQVSSEGFGLLLLRGQQIEKQRAEAALPEYPSHKLIARTVAAASTSMSEEDESPALFRKLQFTLKV
jgi:hypothetical protein